MSKWYEAKIADMFLSPDKKELNIYLDSDDSGAIYVEIIVKDLKKWLKSPKVLPKLKKFK